MASRAAMFQVPRSEPPAPVHPLLCCPLCSVWAVATPALPQPLRLLHLPRLRHHHSSAAPLAPRYTDFLMWPQPLEHELTLSSVGWERAGPRGSRTGPPVLRCRRPGSGDEPTSRLLRCRRIQSRGLLDGGLSPRPAAHTESFLCFESDDCLPFLLSRAHVMTLAPPI